MDFDELERLRRHRKPNLAEARPPSLGRLKPEERPRARPAGASGDPLISRALDLAAGVLLIATVIAPYFRSGNLPIVWGVIALATGCTLAACQALIAFRDPTRPSALATIGGPFWLVLVLPIFAAFQILSIGHVGSFGATSLSPDATALGLVRLASVAFVFALAAVISVNRRRAMQLGWVLFAAAVAHSLLALGNGSEQGITGGFANHNSFAAFAGMGFILGLSLVLGGGRQGLAVGSNGVRLAESILLWLALLVLAIAIATSMSRLGAFSAGCGALAVFVLRGFGADRSTLAFSAVALGALVLGGAGLIERATLIRPAAQTRMELFVQVAEMIRERPLTGWGLDSFPLAFELVHRPPVSSGLVWDQAHNSYLSLWAEMGIVAGSAPIIALVWCGARLLGSVRSGRADALPIAALGCLTAEAVHSLGDFSLEIAGNLYFFVTVLALGLGGVPSNQRRGSR